MTTLTAPPPSFDWGAFLNSLAKAAADLKANAPLAPAVAPSNAAIAAGLTAAQPYIADLAAAIQSHPGAITSADDVLAALQAQGYAWAGDFEALLNSMPGALPMAEEWLPWIGSMLAEFAPAPQPIDKPPAR